MYNSNGVVGLQILEGLSGSLAVLGAVFDYWKGKVSILNILLDFTQKFYV